MKTDDIKKGYILVLTGDRSATMMDNKKGNIRVATVEGFATETGSIYIWDIQGVELTPKQEKSKAAVKAWGF